MAYRDMACFGLPKNANMPGNFKHDLRRKLGAICALRARALTGRANRAIETPTTPNTAMARMAMLNLPVFPDNSPQSMYDRLVATAVVAISAEQAISNVFFKAGVIPTNVQVSQFWSTVLDAQIAADEAKY